MLSIRNATTNDIALIRQLTMLVWPQTYTPILGETQVDYMLEQFYTPASLQQQMENGQQYIICYHNNQPAAFASYSEQEPGIFKLNKIYILPDMQGKGVGKYVIGHIATTLRGMGATKLLLNVNIHNHQAIAFYKKTGFVHVKDEDIDIGSGYYMNDHVLGLGLL